MSEERSIKRLAMLEKAVAAGSEDPFMHYARALELRGLGRLEESLAALTEVETRFAEYVPTFLMAGQIADELGQTQVARGFLERGLTLSAAVGDEHARSELAQALDALDG